jgi:hypothetical protein
VTSNQRLTAEGAVFINNKLLKAHTKVPRESRSTCQRGHVMNSKSWSPAFLVRRPVLRPVPRSLGVGGSFLAKEEGCSLDTLKL